MNATDITMLRCTVRLSPLCNQLISGKYCAVLCFLIPQHFPNPPPPSTQESHKVSVQSL